MLRLAPQPLEAFVRLHHLALRCRDLAQVRDFYEGVLGLAVVREQPGYSVWLAVGDAVLMLEQAAPDEPRPDPSSLQLLAFRLEDAPDDLWERLRARNIEIEDSTPSTRYVRDPEGRRVGVSSYRLPRDPG